jgi:5-(carboxyamino)imidazole ribonucleotide synthase
VTDDSRANAPIGPGATIGVLGSGQLGRMFAIAARRMGYRVHTFSPDYDTPTGQIADVEIVSAYDDLREVANFARQAAVVTFEFENVPTATAEAAARYAPVRPKGSILHTTQQRIREKAFLKRAGLPVTPYREVHSLSDLQQAVFEFGCPAVLKTAAFGYDGKGQFRIESPDHMVEAWNAIGREESVLEAFIDFEREISVVAARGQDGQFVHYGAIENQHSQRILDISIAPARVPAELANEAVEMTRCVLEKLGVVGVLCVEFFVTRAGKLLINELAPRPHNSGHLTVDACVTSQFEQQLRAVCGLRLGSTEMHRPAAMANLLGDLWANGEPDWTAVSAFPDVKLHLYGKLEPRPGRKMGHLTALNRDPEEAYQMVLNARQSLMRLTTTAP